MNEAEQQSRDACTAPVKCEQHAHVAPSIFMHRKPSRGHELVICCNVKYPCNEHKRKGVNS
jgi:hypothetical protein